MPSSNPVPHRSEVFSNYAVMPRHRQGYDDDIEEVKGKSSKKGYDEDDYDETSQPQSTKGKKEEKEIDDKLEVDPDYHGAIIGAKGAQLRALEDETMCYIDVPKNDKGKRDSVIWITGYRADVEYAKKRIKEIVAEKKAQEARRNQSGVLAQTGKNEVSFPALEGQETVTIAVDVEKFAHGKVIGTKGARLRDLKERLQRKEGAASSFNVHLGVDVIVPDRDDPSSIVTIHVPGTVAPRAESIIKEFFQFYEIQPHLISIKVIGDVSMKGDSSTKGEKAAKGSSASTPVGPSGRPSDPPAPAQPTASPAGGEKGSKSENSAPKERSKPLHVDPTAVVSQRREPASPSASSAAAQPVILVPGPNEELHQRKPRFAAEKGVVIDRCKSNAYTHPVLPPRRLP
jgi:predicted RNA-binding protein YlqC (UPF0109 family)